MREQRRRRGSGCWPELPIERVAQPSCRRLVARGVEHPPRPHFDPLKPPDLGDGATGGAVAVGWTGHTGLAAQDRQRGVRRHRVVGHGAPPLGSDGHGSRGKRDGRRPYAAPGPAVALTEPLRGASRCHGPPATAPALSGALRGSIVSPRNRPASTRSTLKERVNRYVAKYRFRSIRTMDCN